MYIGYMDANSLPKDFAANWRKTGEKIFKKSMLLSLEGVEKALGNFSASSAKRLAKDPAFQ